MSTISAVF